jgi:hypothetical protein
MPKTKFLLSFLIVVISFAYSKGTVNTNNPPIGSQPTLAQKVAFLAYTAKFSKSYSSTSEFNLRFQNWLATDNFLKTFEDNKVIVQHNKLSDWTSEEKNGLLNSKLATEVLDIPVFT